MKGLDEAKKKFVEITQEDVSQAAMRAQCKKELDEIEKRFVEWKN